ncbi:MAG: type II toxin-antitoxin system prevent-host-death family antitoxin [Planctomycetes bacterium]|nr:type II toxin-antitoxin system prevent-host-death family antitoxin [Planctomycetota bacterium]
MKAVNIAELKNHLSRYLRAVRRGERILVLDRREPVAQIVPPPKDAESPWERLAREGKVILGTQDWKTLRFTKLPKPVPIQQVLDEVRGDR